MGVAREVDDQAAGAVEVADPAQRLHPLGTEGVRLAADMGGPVTVLLAGKNVQGLAASLGQLGATLRFHDLRESSFDAGGTRVTTRYMNHPGLTLGYRLEDIAGQDAEKLARASEGDRGALDEVESLMLALRNSQQRSEHQRPSMGQDMQKGRRTEIDFINGVIVERGRAIGKPVSTHEKLIAAVKKVELGHAPPSPEHLYAI